MGKKSKKREYTPVNCLHVKVPLEIDKFMAIDKMAVRAELMGPFGVKHITAKTGAVLMLRGQGSGFLEPYGQESREPLHLRIEHRDLTNLHIARTLAVDYVTSLHNKLQLKYPATLSQKPAAEIQDYQCNRGENTGVSSFETKTCEDAFDDVYNEAPGDEEMDLYEPNFGKTPYESPVFKRRKLNNGEDANYQASKNQPQHSADPSTVLQNLQQAISETLKSNPNYPPAFSSQSTSNRWDQPPSQQWPTIDQTAEKQKERLKSWWQVGKQDLSSGNSDHRSKVQPQEESQHEFSCLRSTSVPDNTWDPSKRFQPQKETRNEDHCLGFIPAPAIDLTEYEETEQDNMEYKEREDGIEEEEQLPPKSLSAILAPLTKFSKVLTWQRNPAKMSQLSNVLPLQYLPHQKPEVPTSMTRLPNHSQMSEKRTGKESMNSEQVSTSSPVQEEMAIINNVVCKLTTPPHNGMSLYSSLAHEIFGPFRSESEMISTAKTLQRRTMRFVRSNRSLFHNEATCFYREKFPNHTLDDNTAFDHCCLLLGKPGHDCEQIAIEAIATLFSMSIVVLYIDDNSVKVNSYNTYNIKTVVDVLTCTKIDPLGPISVNRSCPLLIVRRNNSYCAVDQCEDKSNLSNSIPRDPMPSYNLPCNALPHNSKPSPGFNHHRRGT